jgi:uncharacterized protein DUF3592
MTIRQPPKSQLTAQRLVGLMVLFAGLCTAFVFVVSVAEAWREHTQARWPQATARIQQCSVQHRQWFRGNRPRESLYIGCRISYLIRAEEIVTRIQSRSVTPGEKVFWQYPPVHAGLLEAWVYEHPSGSTIVVHYDPADHKNAVLANANMPYSGSRTPNNLKLLTIATIAWAVLLTTARMLRPTSATPPAPA